MKSLKDVSKTVNLVQTRLILKMINLRTELGLNQKRASTLIGTKDSSSLSSWECGALTGWQHKRHGPPTEKNQNRLALAIERMQNPLVREAIANAKPDKNLMDLVNELDLTKQIFTLVKPSDVADVVEAANEVEPLAEAAKIVPAVENSKRSAPNPVRIGSQSIQGLLEAKLTRMENALQLVSETADLGPTVSNIVQDALAPAF